ncbi:MAG TPA: hypothetical protein VK894_01745 [Jiangellales bacterium]|nr:hypothetical protein [Jiangellales bacterium]
MVAVFWQLKWRLLRNGWRGGATRVAASALGALAGAGLAALGVAGAAGLRLATPEVASTAVVLAGSLLVLGWVVLPVVAYGVDETLDPSRFALLPLPRRTLLAGLLAAGFLGVPALATALVSLGTVVTWSRGVLPVLYALAGAALGTLLCVVASRAVTTALSSVLQGRRARDVLSVVAVLGLSSIGLVQLGVTRVAERTSEEVLDRVVAVLAWTPLGAAWAAPYDAVAGAPLTGLARLGLAASAVVLLLAGWEVALGRQLEGAGPSAGAAEVRGGRTLTPAVVRRLLPGGPAGAVASRSLRYWWRDPRQRVTLIVLPVVLAVVAVGPAAGGLPRDLLLVVGPAVAALLGLTMLNETAWDGTALWMHLASGMRGRDDRLGRVLAALLWGGPTTVVVGTAATLLAGRPALLPAVVGATVTVLLAGLAVSAVVGVVAPFSVAEAGTNPFGTTNGGNVVTIAQQLLGAGVTAGLSLPAVAGLGAAFLWSPALGWAVLLAGPAYGAWLLQIGVRLGGRHLEEHGPEVLERITHRR